MTWAIMRRAACCGGSSTPAWKCTCTAEFSSLELGTGAWISKLSEGWSWFRTSSTQSHWANGCTWWDESRDNVAWNRARASSADALPWTKHSANILPRKRPWKSFRPASVVPFASSSFSATVKALGAIRIPVQYDACASGLSRSQLRCALSARSRTASKRTCWLSAGSPSHGPSSSTCRTWPRSCGARCEYPLTDSMNPLPPPLSDQCRPATEAAYVDCFRRLERYAVSRLADIGSGRVTGERRST
mmetsp:Transcript_108154/g.305782  ORF Transcript_108154/g.305782 Transcript_108154/m.305782 type:complete len:246 (-) Transcript_108154:964-1701(-)